MAHYDFIIIGLGSAGAATCMTLACRGFKVLGIDQYHPPHSMGSHHGASRSVRRAYLEGTSYVSMALNSWELWRKLEHDSGQRLLTTTGNLTIGPPESPAVSGFLSSARLYDIPHECLSAAEIQKRWPPLVPPQSFVGGLEVEAGIVSPELSVAAFLTEAKKAGAALVFNERVNRWTEGPTRIEVQTASKMYEADRLLIAAGAWTGTLLDLPAQPLMPKRVPVHWIQAPPGRGFHLGNYPVNFWQIPIENPRSTAQTYKEFYTLPVIEKGEKIKAAFHNGLVDCDPDTLNREVLEEETLRVRELISELIPSLQGRPITSEVCLYSMTPDGHFYLGKRPGSDRVVGVALAGHGFKFAPVLGEILADLMADRAPAFDVDLFSPSRFDYKGKEPPEGN